MVIHPREFLQLSDQFPVIDVRSPDEFNAGHIPNAQNIPIFTNKERAVIGTIYKQIGKNDAILEGLKIVGPKLSIIVEKVQDILKKRNVDQVLVHCWRGGMRSNSVAWLLNTCGIKSQVLRGGYKGYRSFIRSEFSNDAQLLILGGLTGSGKTEMLSILKERGEQVIDLEGLANHKGSAFGQLGLPDQPTNEQFENDCYDIWRKFDFTKRIWIEGESPNIGKVRINDNLLNKMRTSKMIIVEISRDIRVDRILSEYGHFDIESLKYNCSRIAKKLGGLNLKNIFKFLDEGNLKAATMILLDYYDKNYLYGLTRRPKDLLEYIQLESSDINQNVNQLLKKYY